MRPSTALRQHRDRIRQIALSHRVSDVRVFGSVLRGEDRDGSDLDNLRLKDFLCHIIEAIERCQRYVAGIGQGGLPGRRRFDLGASPSRTDSASSPRRWE